MLLILIIFCFNFFLSPLMSDCSLLQVCLLHSAFIPSTYFFMLLISYKMGNQVTKCGILIYEEKYVQSMYHMGEKYLSFIK